VATNGDIVAVITNEWDGDECVPDGIGVYDASSLRYTGAFGWGGSWRDVTICGPRGGEIFVRNCGDQFAIQSRGVRQEQRTGFYSSRSTEGIPTIGCETHFIAVTGRELRLWRVTEAPQLLHCLRSEVLGRDCVGNELFSSLIAWGKDGHFVVYRSIGGSITDGPVEGEISVWRLDTESDQLIRIQMFEVGIYLNAVALADDYVAGASKDKKVHIWNRQTGEKIWSDLCDVDEEDELDEEDDHYDDDHIHPLSLSCHGHVLVATSHLGCAICVWDMKRGKLWKKYNHAEEERRVDRLPLGTDVTSMAYVSEINGFLCMTGYMNIWTFPTNNDQSKAAHAIRKREDDARKII